MRFLCVTALFATLLGAQAHAAETEVTIPVKPGVTESFLVDLPAHPIAAAILIPGGPGRFRIVHNPDGSYSANNNFLSRTRQMYAQAGIATLLLDVPSNHRYGITEWFRGSPANTRNIAAAAAWLQQQSGRKVWLVGTSLGTISAASSAIRLGARIGGLVLTSSISAKGRSAPDGGLAALNLNRIDVPVLVMDDTLDACPISPPQNAPVLARRLTASPHVSTVLIPAGATPESGPCDPLSYHGYFGAEAQAVNTITSFIATNQR